MVQLLLGNCMLPMLGDSGNDVWGGTLTPTAGLDMLFLLMSSRCEAGGGGLCCCCSCCCW